MIRAIPIPIEWHAGLPVYASESYLKTVSDQYGWIAGFDESGNTRCLLPYSMIRRSIFRLIRFPTQTIAIDGDLSIEDERDFLDAAVKHFQSIGADLIVPATFNTVFRTYPHGAAAAPFGSYVIDLRQEEKALWAGLHSKHRNVIRSATKKGVLIRSGPEHLDACYPLVRDSFLRSAKGFTDRLRVRLRMDRDEFKRQVVSLGDQVEVFVAEYEGVVQGCAVIPFSRHSAYYMHGGGIRQPVTGAMNLLHWEAMRRFRDLGVNRYDFFGARLNPVKGSKMEGIIKFKERFGGSFAAGYMWKISFRPAKYFLYSLASRLRSKGDVVDQENRRLDGAGS